MGFYNQFGLGWVFGLKSVQQPWEPRCLPESLWPDRTRVHSNSERHRNNIRSGGGSAGGPASVCKQLVGQYGRFRRCSVRQYLASFYVRRTGQASGNHCRWISFGGLPRSWTSFGWSAARYRFLLVIGGGAVGLLFDGEVPEKTLDGTEQRCFE